MGNKEKIGRKENFWKNWEEVEKLDKIGKIDKIWNLDFISLNARALVKNLTQTVI